MKDYEKTLGAIRPEVSLGYETIHVFQAPELASLQIGYSVSPTGETLIGGKDGDWLANWLVIGYEDLCGDPIFIDTSVEGFPVFTAIHGEGRWDPAQIADSLGKFGRALSLIADVAKGREFPRALKENPVTPSEKEATLAALRRDNPYADLEFWNVMLTE